MDPTTGVMLNPDMELYKLAGASDIPEIIVIPYDTPEMRNRGVIGKGGAGYSQAGDAAAQIHAVEYDLVQPGTLTAQGMTNGIRKFF